MAFWIFLSILLLSPLDLPTSCIHGVSSFSPFPRLIFFFLCIVTYLYKRKKGTIGKSVLRTQCPWSPSIRGIITPTFMCNWFLISVRLHSSNQSFYHTKLDDFPYRFWLRSLHPLPRPRRLSISQSWNVFITILNVVYGININHWWITFTKIKKRKKQLFVVQWNTSTWTKARTNA